MSTFDAGLRRSSGRKEGSIRMIWLDRTFFSS